MINCHAVIQECAHPGNATDGAPSGSIISSIAPLASLLPCSVLNKIIP